MLSEQRKHSRLRTILAARILLNNGASTIDCIVRNLSTTGARIKVDAPFALPERFQLLIPKNDLHRPAQIRWRREGEVGVEFVD